MQGMTLIYGKFQNGTLINNVGDKVTYIKGLQRGDILVAKKAGEKCKGDIGASNLTYDYEPFIPGHEYRVHHIYNWSGDRVAYVQDEDCTLHFATPDLFDVKEPKAI